MIARQMSWPTKRFRFSDSGFHGIRVAFHNLSGGDARPNLPGRESVANRGDHGNEHPRDHKPRVRASPPYARPPPPKEPLEVHPPEHLSNAVK